ncbi:hypothetical protein Tco_1501578 [Tanacetum coccineum]
MELTLIISPLNSILGWYIYWIPDDIKPSIVYPKIGDDVEFKINANFMRELRRKIFAGTDDEDACKPVRTVSDCRSLPLPWRHSREIQCASSDTRPPMLDKTDFASMATTIRLYLQYPTSSPLTALESNLDSVTEEKDKVQMQTFGNKHHTSRVDKQRTDKNRVIINGAGAVGYGGAQNRVGNANTNQAKAVKCLQLQQCKKRTPTGITEGGRGFEQTKACFLTEVIPFLKTLQEHFEGIQKALTKEVKEMSDAFDELEAELDQSIVDRKHDEIEWKNLLIEHDNIIADGLSKEVFYVASNSELNETHSELDRPLDLRARNFQISQLTEKVNSLQEENEFFRAENAKIKQHYKELYDSIKIMRTKHTEQTNALKKENESLRHLKESVDTLREIVEEAKVERPLDSYLAFACRYTKHSQELLEYAFGTCPKVFNQLDKKHANTPRKKQVTFADQCATSSGVNSLLIASGSQL